MLRFCEITLQGICRTAQSRNQLRLKIVVEYYYYKPPRAKPTNLLGTPCWLVGLVKQ